MALDRHCNLSAQSCSYQLDNLPFLCNLASSSFLIVGFVCFLGYIFMEVYTLIHWLHFIIFSECDYFVTTCESVMFVVRIVHKMALLLNQLQHCLKFKVSAAGAKNGAYTFLLASLLGFILLPLC